MAYAFSEHPVAIITKMDLAEAVEFSSEMVRRNIQSVRPGMEVFELSTKTGFGFGKFLAWLDGLKKRQ